MSVFNSGGPGERRALIDEFGALTAEIARFAPKLKRHKELRDEIESWYAGHAADRAFRAEGLRYEALVGERKWQRRIVDMHRLYRLLTKSRFLACCTFPLEALDRNASEEERRPIVERERTGPREIRAVPLPAQAAEVLLEPAA